MDGRGFDELTRRFAKTGSRRSLVRAAGAGIAAAVALRAGGTAAACGPDQVASRGRCLCKTTGRPPVGGVCPCPVGQERCDKVCVNLSTDEANCGTCGNPCADLETCLDGACTCLFECCADEECPSGLCFGGTCSFITTTITI